MAIARGRESVEAQEFKRYIGVAPVFISAVNPNKAEHEALFNTELEEAPTYVGKKSDNDGNEFQTARISVVFRPDTEKIGFDMPLVTMALFLENRPRYNADKTKIQVIDKYGNTAWPTIEEAEAHAIILKNKEGKDYNSNLDKDYRPAYVGEEELMHFVKVYLGIPNRFTYDKASNTYVPNTKVKLEECECRFDNLSAIFKGDFSEVKEAIGFQPTNKIKVLLGVRTDAESGKLYQSVYTRGFLSNAATNYSNLDKEIQKMIASAVANGRIINTEYEVTAVHEYSVTPTQFTAVETPADDEDMPFAAPTGSKSPWDE
jgi:hypothetical protein